MSRQDTTEMGRNEVYDSILKDFEDSPEAREAVCIRHLAKIENGPVDPAYPMALKSCITDLMQHTVVKRRRG